MKPEQIVDYLFTQLHPGDALVSNAIINYELLRRAPKFYASLSNPEEAPRVVAVVVKRTGTSEICANAEAMALLAAQETADPGVLAEKIDLNRYEPPEIGAKFLTSTVYFLPRKSVIK
jgi:hypothetical protein